MKVKDLITMISRYPDDMEVCVAGYEGGYSDVCNIEEANLALNYNPDVYYYGPHERVNSNFVEYNKDWIIRKSLIIA